MMKTALAGLCLAAALACNLQAGHLPPDQALDAILARMDAAAPKFHSLSADVVMVEYEKLLNDSTTDTGTLQMNKGKKTTAILTFPDRVIGFLGSYVRIYFPKVNHYEDHPLGNNSDIVNQILLLGFGSSGSELAKSYKISLQGTENVAGQQTSKLLLIPTDSKVKERLTQINVWIPENGANPVQQQFFEPSGNWRKVTYSNIVLNPPSISGTLEMKLPPGASK